MAFCTIEISSSPFVNFGTNSIGKVFFGHTNFFRNSQANKKEISVVDAYTGWNFEGNEGYVSTSYLTLNDGCILEKNPRIEYLN